MREVTSFRTDAGFQIQCVRINIGEHRHQSLVENSREASHVGDGGGDHFASAGSCRAPMAI